MALVIEREKDKDKDNSEDCDVKMGGDENKDGDKMETEGDRKKDNVFRSNADTLKKPMLKGVSVLRFAAITQLTSEIDSKLNTQISLTQKQQQQQQSQRIDTAPFFFFTQT